MRYNCSILDLHRRKIVASVNGTEITARLAIQALEKAIIGNQPPKGLIVHSDQGSQFTSKEFISYCKEHHIQQSMSRAGSPTDNAVMERYFNTLKHECIYQYSFKNDVMLNKVIGEFTYSWYNQKRPHSYNNGQPPVVPI